MTDTPDLFQPITIPSPLKLVDKRKVKEQLARIDGDEELRKRLLPYCRLKHGEVWDDPKGLNRVGVFDATRSSEISALLDGVKPTLAINDPPYNIVVGTKNTAALFKKTIEEYDQFSYAWSNNILRYLNSDASFYVWLGADYKNGFHPIPEFCQMMRQFVDWQPRNWITVRNQRGYGTQKNWMWVRQELLYYTKGAAYFDVNAEYTDIPKILRGYYKKVGGKITENLERSKSDTIRAGNVWIDIQQVFYRLEENVPGCYAQKPLKAVERIIKASSEAGSVVVDPFCHSGTTLLAGERLARRMFVCDIDPIYAEITIRRLERYRNTGKIGWQWQTPFPEYSA